MQNLVVSTGQCESESAKVRKRYVNCCREGAHNMCQIMGKCAEEVGESGI